MPRLAFPEIVTPNVRNLEPSPQARPIGMLIMWCILICYQQFSATKETPKKIEKNLSAP